MALITTAYAATAVVSFIVLWAVIHFGSRIIPPNDSMPVWKSFVLAAAATVINMLLIGLITGALSPSG